MSDSSGADLSNDPSDPETGFRRRPRSKNPGEPTTHSIPPAPSRSELFFEDIERIELRIAGVVEGGREGFVEGAPHYDRASMAMIRLAAMFEDDYYDEFLGGISDDERRGIASMRNFAAHRGYRVMNDDWLWEAVTLQIPALLARLRDDNGFGTRSLER